MGEMRELFLAHKVCAILRCVPVEQTLAYAGAAYGGGIRMFEVALNSPNALEQIAMLRKKYGEKAMIGAGTAVTPHLVRRAREAGAQFMLTPSSPVEVLAYCRDQKILLLPGVMTPTDVGLCIQYGFDTMKLFPAGDLPGGYIKSLKGPFDGTDYVAVGGVTPENLPEFFHRGFIGAGVGSNLIAKKLVEAGAWDEAQENISQMMKNLSKAKEC